MQTCWVVEKYGDVAKDLLKIAREAEIPGKIVPIASASLAFGPEIGIAWLPDDKLLILLILLFGTTAYASKRSPDLPSFLQPLEEEEWLTEILFSSTTKCRKA